MSNNKNKRQVNTTLNEPVQTTLDSEIDTSETRQTKITGGHITHQQTQVENNQNSTIGISVSTKKSVNEIEVWRSESSYSKTLSDILDTPTESDTENNTDSESFSNSRETRDIEPISNYAYEYSESADKSTEEHTQRSHSKSGVKVIQKQESDQSETKQDTEIDQRRVVGDTVTEQKCHECNGDIIQEESDHYCEDCGMLIADEYIDPGPEWRAYNSKEQDNKSRVGSPMKNTMHDKGLSTVIGADGTDANGKQLSGKKQREMSRLRKWDKRFKVKDSKERNLRQAFGEIQRISSEIDIPDYVEETACTVYKRAVEEELLPGRSIEAMASASVQIAMRQAGIPKTIDSLINYCRVSKSKVTGAYSYMCRELNIKIEPPEVLEYLSRIASELEVTKETERQAEELLELSVKENIHSGKNPSGMAASAIYAATIITRKDRVTQKMACESADVCELTIRNRNRELLETFGIDYDETSPPSREEVKSNKSENGLIGKNDF